MSKPKLPLYDLSLRHVGLTDAIAAYYTEAARVCLDRHYQSPIDFDIDDSGEKLQALTEWEATDDRTKSAWANEIDTTEAGAYACVLAAVELANGMVAVYRAETKTGADYYIAPAEGSIDDLEGCLRLEVSGIDKGLVSSVVQRLKAKLDQAASGASNLPAMAGVVGFQARLIMLKPVDNT